MVAYSTGLDTSQSRMNNESREVVKIKACIKFSINQFQSDDTDVAKLFCLYSFKIVHNFFQI